MTKTTAILIHVALAAIAAAAICNHAFEKRAKQRQETQAKADSLTEAIHTAAGRIPDTLKGSFEGQELLQHALELYDRQTYYRDLSMKNTTLYESTGALQYKCLAFAFADSARYFRDKLNRFNHTLKK